jgi:hypothetical protein
LGNTDVISVINLVDFQVVVAYHLKYNLISRKELSMFRLILPLLVMIPLNYGCGLPHYIWPQSDIEFYEINQETLDEKILIASRKSEFKNAVVNKIEDAFIGKAVYIKIIGLDSLKNEDAKRYSAVLIINTGMAWEIDRKAEAFLDKYGALDSVIVLTTCMSGDMLPDMEDRQIDAISCASAEEQINPVADEIIGKLDKIIGGSTS